MIFDTISHGGHYRGICSTLDTALDFMEHTDLAALPLGRTSIVGEEVFINVMNATTHAIEAGEYEWHRRYADIQLDLEGTEAVATALWGEETKAFSGDIGFAKGEAAAQVVLGPGRFTLCMPGELHHPGIAPDGTPAPIKKCVIKVAMGGLEE